MTSSGAKLLILEEQEAASAISCLLSEIKDCEYRLSSYQKDASADISEFLPDLILFAHHSSQNLETFHKVKNKYSAAEIIVSLPDPDAWVNRFFITGFWNRSVKVEWEKSTKPKI